jgi:hypothetical protein
MTYVVLWLNETFLKQMAAKTDVPPYIYIGRKGDYKVLSGRICDGMK